MKKQGVDSIMSAHKRATFAVTLVAAGLVGLSPTTGWGWSLPGGVDGRVGYLEVKANASLSVQITDDAGHALTLCNTADYPTYMEAVVGKTPNLTADGVKGVLTALLAAKLAGKLVRVYTYDATPGIGGCHFGTMYLH